MRFSAKRVANVITQQLWGRLDELTSDQLRRVIRHVEGHTQTNCGWQSYRTGPTIADAAKEILLGRAHIARYKARKAQGGGA